MTTITDIGIVAQWTQGKIGLVLCPKEGCHAFYSPDYNKWGFGDIEPDDPASYIGDKALKAYQSGVCPACHTPLKDSGTGD